MVRQASRQVRRLAAEYVEFVPPVGQAVFDPADRCGFGRPQGRGGAHSPGSGRRFSRFIRFDCYELPHAGPAADGRALFQQPAVVIHSPDAESPPPEQGCGPGLPCGWNTVL